MPRAGLDTEQVVTAAAALADAEGLEALTLARLAERLDVRSPSLYAHVGGLEDLRERVGARGTIELADRLGEAAAGRSGGEALAAIAVAYRAYAHERPGSYAALQRANERDVDGARRVVATVVAALRGYGLEGETAIHGARAVRSALHGFVTLEAQQGFGMPVDLDTSFTFIVATLDRGLRGGGRQLDQPL